MTTSLDTVRRSFSASALTASDLKKGRFGARHDRFDGLPSVCSARSSSASSTRSRASATKRLGRYRRVPVGISEALVETALGLVVAIPAVWIYNYLTSRIE